MGPLLQIRRNLCVRNLCVRREENELKGEIVGLKVNWEKGPRMVTARLGKNKGQVIVQVLTPKG